MRGHPLLLLLAQQASYVLYSLRQFLTNQSAKNTLIELHKGRQSTNEKYKIIIKGRVCKACPLVALNSVTAWDFFRTLLINEEHYFT